MKKRTLFLRAALCAAALAMLVGCGQPKAVPAVWQGTLENTGTAVSAGGCGVTAEQKTWQPDDAAAATLLLLDCDGCPTLELQGVTESEVVITYAEPDGDAYRPFTDRLPTPKVDYWAAEQEGTLRIRFDTVYQYLVTVKTDAGSDSFLVSCTDPHKKSK